MRAYPEIAANWAEAGITPDKRDCLPLRKLLAHQQDLPRLSAGLAAREVPGPG